jgi:hypothetical protein
VVWVKRMELDGVSLDSVVAALTAVLDEQALVKGTLSFGRTVVHHRTADGRNC